MKIKIKLTLSLIKEENKQFYKRKHQEEKLKVRAIINLFKISIKLIDKIQSLNNKEIANKILRLIVFIKQQSLHNFTIKQCKVKFYQKK